MKRVLAFLVLYLGGAVLAQESASFKLTEHAFNAGGNPRDGVVLTSTSYQVTLSALGDSAAATGLTSVSFELDGGFATGYPPPGEVSNLRFTDVSTLVWDAEPSIGDYALYRGTITMPFDPGFGSCVLPPLTTETATDTTVVPSGEVLFFLVTAHNRLREEATKGFISAGPERGNSAPCP